MSLAKNLVMVVGTKELNDVEPVFSLMNPEYPKELWDFNDTPWSAACNGNVACVVKNNRYSVSFDGSNWNTGTFGEGCGGDRVVGGPGILMAFGPDGANAKSLDSGETWKHMTAFDSTAFATDTGAVRGVWDGNKFVIITDSGNSAVTIDGETVNVSSQFKTVQPASTTIRNIITDGNIYLALLTAGYIARSTDGLNWTIISALRTTSWGTTTINCGLWDGSKFIVFGSSGRMATSTDGISWTYTSISSLTGNISPNACAYINEKYILVGGSRQSSVSTNLTSWTNSTTAIPPEVETNSPYAFCVTPDRLISFYINGMITMTTDEGSTFSFEDGLSHLYTYWGKANVNKIVYINDKFFAVGDNARVATSVDGINWTLITHPMSLVGRTRHFYDICWNGFIYVLVGSYGNLLTSSDGLNWTKRTANMSTNDIYAVNWNGSQFLVVGLQCKAATSTNGTTWTYRGGIQSLLGITRNAFKIIWDGSKYIVSCSGSNICYSDNGLSWTLISFSPFTQFSADRDTPFIANDTNVYITTSSYSAQIINSTDGINWLDAGFLSTDINELLGLSYTALVGATVESDHFVLALQSAIVSLSKDLTKSELIKLVSDMPELSANLITSMASNDICYVFSFGSGMLAVLNK